MASSTEEKIVRYLEKYVSLTEDERDSIMRSLNYKTFEKGTHLLRQGQVSKECYFNIEGLVRQYELHGSEEKTTYFYLEGEALVAFDSAAKQVPCEFNWVCEEDTTLVIGRLDKIAEEYEKNPKLEKLSALFISHEFGKYQNLSSSLITLTAEQRYLKLSEERPELLSRVPQYHLASFLGVKPETLSRIRKRLSRKKQNAEGR